MKTTALKKMTTGMRLESLKFVGGSKFMKELQNSVFSAAYDSVEFSSWKSFTDKERKEMLRRSILGSEDTDDISLPEPIILGVKQFAHLCNNVPIENSDDRNETSTALGGSATNYLILGGSSRCKEYDKRLKVCFPQKGLRGKLHI
jgi:hypothetical protein